MDPGECVASCTSQEVERVVSACCMAKWLVSKQVQWLSVWSVVCVFLVPSAPWGACHSIRAKWLWFERGFVYSLVSCHSWFVFDWTKNSDDFCKCLSGIVPIENHTVNLVPEGFSVYYQSASSPSGRGSTKELGTLLCDSWLLYGHFPRGVAVPVEGCSKCLLPPLVWLWQG